MIETEDLVQMRKLNLELLKQLWAGQDAVRRSVAEVASKSRLDPSSSHNAEMPSSPEITSTTSRTSAPPSVPQDGPCDLAWPSRTSSLAVCLPTPWCQHQKSPGQTRPHSTPLLVTSDLNGPEFLAGLDNPRPQENLRSMLTPRQSKPSKPRVTFSQEPAVPQWNWRLRPYLGYDWIAGSLDSTSPVTDKSEAFFSKLRNFREANKDDCVYSDPEHQFLSLLESSDVDENHECVYCYRVNRRLFVVPADPGTPCRLCRVQRGQRGPETLAEPAQVRVSIPLSVLEPPHRYRIHRRKSFDASDTLALPRHCLLGWDSIPPKPEKSSAPSNVDLWSCVSSEAWRQKLSVTSPTCLALPTRARPPTPIWSEPQVTQPRTPRQKR